MHYPPYSSKYNPIEHRLFSQITRLYIDTSLLSIKEVRDRTTNTTTTKGLVVHVDISEKIYETKRAINLNYKKMLNKHVLFQKELPKWNYQVKTI